MRRRGGWRRSIPIITRRSSRCSMVSWVDSLVGQFKTTLYTIAAAVALLLSDRVRQRREHAAGARDRAREGDGDPVVAGREPVAADRATAGGERCCWRSAARCSGAYSRTAASRALAALIPDGLIPREAEIRLNVPVHAVRAGDRDGDGVDLRARPGVADGAEEYRRAAAGFGQGRQRRLPEGAAAQRAGDRRGGAVADPALPARVC